MSNLPNQQPKSAFTLVESMKRTQNTTIDDPYAIWRHQNGWHLDVDFRTDDDGIFLRIRRGDVIRVDESGTISAVIRTEPDQIVHLPGNIDDWFDRPDAIALLGLL